jgi:Ca2+-binding EF-hand superfamily protein
MDAFNKNDDGKMTFYYFYKLIQETMKLNIPKKLDWLISDLESDLDYDNTATIDFEDISDFMRKHYKYVIDKEIPDKPEPE